VVLFATSEFFDVSNLKRQKILTWQTVPRQNCPISFFFFGRKNSFKNQISFFFFFIYKLLICYVEQIKHGVDRSLRPNGVDRKTH
jgi:hypothetical protein